MKRVLVVCGSMALAVVAGCGPRSLAVAPPELGERIARGETPMAVLSLDVGDDSLASFAATKQRIRAASPGLDVVHELQQLPLLAVRLHEQADLDELIAMPDVFGIEADREYHTTDALALINQPTVVAAGRDGRNTTVAVLDTGVDWKRAAFGTCTAPGSAGCRVAAAVEIAADDGVLDDAGHGTNVAGIIAQTAPGARVVSLDVFAEGVATGTDLLAAMDWVMQNRTTYNIVAVNMSLGGSTSTTICADHSLETVFARARAVGVIAAVASGNDGLTDQIAWPSCSPSAVSVGAVYDKSVGTLSTKHCTDTTTATDRVACFSNTAPFLSVLAPGVGISAAGITMTGTSQATPHVAAAAAILRSAFPSETADQIVKRLVSTGVPVKDPRVNITKPRLDLAAATKVTGDTTAPTGSIRIGDGAALTNRTPQTLTIAATDASGVAQMCIATSPTCTAWETFAPTRAITLPAGEGAKTVYAWFADTAGNRTSTPVTASVTLDTTPPSVGTATANATSGSAITVAWSGITDTNGVASIAVYAATKTPPPTCNGTAVYSGTATSFVHSGLAGGTTYGYRVCGTDRAGNTSIGAVATATTKVSDVAPPTGAAITINAGAQFTRSTNVMLTLAATDPSGVSACVSNDSACASYAAFSAQRAWILTSGDGVKSVAAWFRDGVGNTTSPVSDTIVLDTIAPSNPLVIALPQNGAAKLTWTASFDAGSGVDRYRVVVSPDGTAPAVGCSNGTVLFEGATRTAMLKGEGPYGVRVCAIDRAGNIASGRALSVVIPRVR